MASIRPIRGAGRSTHVWVFSLGTRLRPLPFAVAKLECRHFFQMSKFRLGLVTGLTCALPLGLSFPAHAIDACRTGATSYSLAELSATGFTCQLGDKIYSDFSLTGLSSGSFIFTNPIPNFHTFQGQGVALTAGSSASYNYKIAIDPAVAPPGTKFLNFSTTTAVSDVGSGVDSSKSLSDGTNTVTSGNGINSPAYTYSPTISGPITFTSNIVVTQGLMTQFTDSVMQQATTPVPGPLPILGAGALFGFSRQLRKRIKAS
jgi:hypothetical protein